VCHQCTCRGIIRLCREKPEFELNYLAELRRGGRLGSLRVNRDRIERLLRKIGGQVRKETGAVVEQVLRFTTIKHDRA